MQLSPESAIKSHEELARSLFRLGYFDEVVQTTEHAMELGSKTSLLRARRAWALARLGRATEAMREGDLALSQDQAFPRSDEDQIRVLCALGQIEEALAALDGCLAHDSSDLEARGVRALLLEAAGRHIEARAELERVITGCSHQEGEQSDALRKFAQIGLETEAA
ncbi:MAG: tetratricopeptide (TPR) repeat protein [Planctomycetota bacterium]|jgi:tetratricopeptide (TPR) repeat protein